MKNFNQELEQERKRLHAVIDHYFDDKPTPIRREINTRSAFAKEQGEKWFKVLRNIQKVGNVVSSVATRKFVQATRIYAYYNNEFVKYIKRDAPMLAHTIRQR